MDICRHLENIQMTKFPFFRVIVNRAKLLAFRARKFNALGMLNKKINTAPALFLSNLGYLPRAFNTQKLFKEISDVFHNMKINQTLYLGGTH
jgi:hypothetical protein